MIRSCINICLLAVISLLLGVIWQSSAIAAAPTLTNLGQINTTFREAVALALDGSGNLYVSDVRQRAILKFDRYGSQVATLSVPALKGEGLAIAADGRIFVSESTDGIYADKVAILDAAGNEVGALGVGVNEFKMAGDIAFDANGNVYVVDRTDGIVKVYSGNLSTGVQFGSVHYAGSLDMAIDTASNEIYLANYYFDATAGDARTLYVYDAGANLLRTISAVTGFGGDELSRFGDIAFDDASRFYVSDFGLHSIRVLDKPATQVFKYVDGIRQAGSMAYDVATGRLFALHSSSGVDIIGVDGGANPVKVNTPPEVPVPVTVGEVGSATPGLVFNDATDADGDALTYNVKVLDAVGTQVTAFTVAETAGQTVATVNVTLAENASYTWQVQADDGAAVSAWSAPQAIYVNAVQEAPSAPALTSFLGGETAGSGAVLTWSAATDADPNASLSYRVEVLDGVTLAASASFTGLSAPIESLSAQLTPGATYSWQVVAVDNTALETASSNTGSFVFQTSVLKISANVAGAKVYLGGHHGYAGRLVGVAPVEIRDLVPGNYAIVVEAAGFEPVVVSAAVVQDTQTEVAASLKAERLAASSATHDLHLAGQAVQGAGVVPIVADLDRDGVLDLLLANNGSLMVYRGSLVQDPQAVDTVEDLSVKVTGNTPAPARLVFADAPQALALPQVAGAAPCLVDWNNDDNFDLLIGAADGSIKLYLGQGGLNFSSVADEWLVTVSGAAVPAVADVNGDGAKDLVVASGNDLLLFTNVGTDAAPLLGSQALMATLAAPAVPMFNDWNADGAQDLLLLSQGELFQTTVDAGVVTAMSTTGLTVAGAESVFALNIAGSNYSDLVMANSTGALVAVNGQQGGFAPAYKVALQTQLAVVKQAVLDQAPELVTQVSDIASRIGRGKYDSACKKAEELVTLLGADTPAAVAVNGLIGILK